MIKKIKLIYNTLFISPNQYAKKVGVKFGKGCFFRTKKFGTEPFLISMGDNVHTASGVQFITHDDAVHVIRNLYPDKYKNADIFRPIKMGSNIFIGLNSIILPGTEIEDNVLIGAGSVVKGKLTSNSVYASVPAKFICTIEDYVNKNSAFISQSKHMNKLEKDIFLKRNFLKC